VDAFDKSTAEIVLKLKEENKLEEAVDECLTSALAINNLGAQQMLLMSAAFGKAYLANYDNGRFTRAVHTIRLKTFFQNELNVLVPADVLELDQQVSAIDIMMRIATRGAYAAAAEYADRVGCDKSPIVSEWCAKIISQVADDDAAFRIIVGRKAGQFDAAAVAQVAFSMGRDPLALRIAGSEKITSRVVPLYKSRKLWDDALRAAAVSCDSSLFIGVLQSAMEDKDDDEFLAAAIVGDVSSFAAVAKYVGFPPQDDRLTGILRKAEVSSAAFDFHVAHWIKQLMANPSEDKHRELVTAIERHKKFKLKWAERQIKLINTERAAAEQKAAIGIALKRGPDFLQGLSTNDALRQLLKSEGIPAAWQFAHSAKIDKGHFVFVAVGFFASQGRWLDIGEFAGKDYKDTWENVIATLLNRGGEAKARDFITRLALDPAKKPAILAQLENKEFSFEKSRVLGRIEIFN
jgi:hypothetical protein